MIRKTLLSLAMLAMTATAAQAGVSGGISGGGVSGVSGISGGLGIDFAATNVPGAGQGSVGGFAMAVEAAFSAGESPKGEKKRRDE